MLLDFSSKKQAVAGQYKNVSYETFVKDVLEPSLEKVVIVDFWAPWCGPCKHLEPILHSVTERFKDRVLLCKVNVDEEKQLAAQLRVQTLPTCYAFVNGQPVDAFQGNVSEQKLTLFIEKQLEKLSIPKTLDLEKTLKEAHAFFDQSNIEEAKLLYAEILSEIPHHPEALGGLGLCLVYSGALDQAKNVFASIPEEKQSTRIALMLKATISLLDDLSMLHLNESDDKGQRFNSSLELIAQQKLDQAISILLSLMKEDRLFADGAAKVLLLRLFDALGHSHRLTLNGRRTLSAILFS